MNRLARRGRKLNASERRLLARQITAAVPRGKANAITHDGLWRALKGYLQKRTIPVFTAEKILRGLRSRNTIVASTRVGLWRPGPGDPAGGGEVRGPTQAPLPAGWRVRKFVHYACMTCFLSFPSKESARAHWSAQHGKAAKGASQRS